MSLRMKLRPRQKAGLSSNSSIRLQQEMETELERFRQLTQPSTTKEEWLNHGHKWIGRFIRRHLHDSISRIGNAVGAINGMVVAWLPEGKHPSEMALWHVIHEDGDEEDLDAREVQNAVDAYAAWARAKLAAAAAAAPLPPPPPPAGPSSSSSSGPSARGGKRKRAPPKGKGRGGGRAAAAGARTDRKRPVPKGATAAAAAAVATPGQTAGAGAGAGAGKGKGKGKGIASRTRGRRKQKAPLQAGKDGVIRDTCFFTDNLSRCLQSIAAAAPQPRGPHPLTAAMVQRAKQRSEGFKGVHYFVKGAPAPSSELVLRFKVL